MDNIEQIIRLYWEADRSAVRRVYEEHFTLESDNNSSTELSVVNKSEPAHPEDTDAQHDGEEADEAIEADLATFLENFPLPAFIENRLREKFSRTDAFNQLVLLHYFNCLGEKYWSIEHSIEGMLQLLSADLASAILAALFPDAYFPLESSDDLSYAQLRQILHLLGIEYDDGRKTLPIDVWLNLCHAVGDFRVNYAMEPWQMWATVYDLGPRLLPEPPPYPSQPNNIWIVATNDRLGEFAGIDAWDSSATGTWAINRHAKRGDLALMYCTTPRSAFVSVHRVLEDAHYDPFGGWNGYRAKIGEKLTIPWVTIREMKADPVIGAWKLTKGNFQGLLQLDMPQDVWRRLREIIAEKSPETASLLAQFADAGAPVRATKVEGELWSETEVEDRLLLPLLEKLGWQPGVTLQRQVEMAIKVGSGRPQTVRADIVGYAGAFTSVALLLVEAKRKVRSAAELTKARDQAESYAGKLRCARFAVAAPEGFWIYELRFPGQSHELAVISFDGDISEKTLEQLRSHIGFDVLRRAEQPG